MWGICGMLLVWRVTDDTGISTDIGIGVVYMRLATV